MTLVSPPSPFVFLAPSILSRPSFALLRFDDVCLCSGMRGPPHRSRLRCMWYVYADTGIAQLKPKKVLDKERK